MKPDNENNNIRLEKKDNSTPSKKPNSGLTIFLHILNHFQAQITIIVIPIIGYFLFLSKVDPANEPSNLYKNNIAPPNIPNDAWKCAFVLFLMASFWTLQAAPLAVTSLLPIFLFPLLDVGKPAIKHNKNFKSYILKDDGTGGAKVWSPDGGEYGNGTWNVLYLQEECANYKHFPYVVNVMDRISESYMKQLQFLFIGGLIVALAIEEWNIHKRLALFVLSKTGAEPATLMAGFMGVTGFLSMWISNTATTALMIPIAAAVHSQLYPTEEEDEQHHNKKSPIKNNSMGMKPITADSSDDSMKKHHIRRRSSADSDGLAPCQTESTDLLGTTRTLISPLNSSNTLAPYGSHMSHSGLGYTGGSSVIPEEPMNSMVHMDIPLDLDGIKQETKRRIDEGVMVGKMLIISIAYAANIGGIGTIIGTPTNLILFGNKSIFSRINDMNFINWMYYACPLCFFCLILCWVILVVMFMGWSALIKVFRCKRDHKDEVVCAQFRDQLTAMGKMNYGSKLVGMYFLVTAFLWMTRSFQIQVETGDVNADTGKMITKTEKLGWSHWLGISESKDSTVAILISFLLFVTPSKPNLINWVVKQKWKYSKELPVPAPPLINWKKVQKQLAWDVVLLLGGGFALANMCQATGLSRAIGDLIGGVVANLSDSVCILIATVGISITTGFTSNVSTAQVFLPILGEIAVKKCMSVDMIMYPAAVACSFAFILPISTAPNAIAFSTGKLVTTDMLRVGSVVNILLVLITWLWTVYTPILQMSLPNNQHMCENMHCNLPVDQASASFNFHCEYQPINQTTTTPASTLADLLLTSNSTA